MRIILNCDDLGMSPAVNDAILGLMEAGRVTSATLMPNGQAIEDAVRGLRHFPRCSFGVHLVGTEFRPLSSHPGLAPLLNEDGEFAGNLRSIQITPFIAAGMFSEWCAQMDRALALGVPISHIDSHHHVHTEPRLFRMLKQIQKKYRVRKIRISRNVYAPQENPSTQLRLTKNLWNFVLRNYIPTITTDWFTAFWTFYERLKAGLPCAGTIELMCHPGSPLFTAETALLSTNWKQELVPGAEMISYNQL